MLRKPLAFLLSAALLLADFSTALAQMIRPVAAANFPVVAAFPATPAAATSLAAFAGWLGTPQGAQALVLDPGLAGLATLDLLGRGGPLSAGRARLAVAPLVEALAPGVLATLGRIAELPEDERQAALVQVLAARRAAEEAVNAKAARIVAGVGALAYSAQTTPEQLDGLASHLEVFTWLGGGIVEAAAHVRSTATGLRAALEHARTVAEETARRLEALRPKPALIETGFSREARAQAAPARKVPGLTLPIRTFTLDNGLTVVVSPDHASPTVAVSITYKVGSQLESPGRSGFAHLFEHLMAQGTKNLKPREISRLVEGNGGMRNAYTTRTNTTYHSVVPKSALEVVLWAEADRMGSLNVDERALALEKQVVLEEMRRSYLNQPYRKAQDAGMAEAAFKRWENRHTTIGEAEDVRNAKLEDVRAFYEAHYAPNNAVLSIAGDVTVEEARALAARYFGKIPSRTLAPAPDLSEPPLEGERVAVIPDSQAELPRLLVGWRAPERGTRDFWALALLMKLLGGKDESPLYRSVVKEAGQAVSVEADIPWWSNPVTMRGPDLFGLDLLLKLGSSVPEALAAVDRVLGRLSNDGPTNEELALAKARAERQWLEGVSSLIDRAKTLGSYAALVGDPQRITDDLKTLLEVSAADVSGAARRWIRDAGRRIVHVTPAAKLKPAPEPATPPVPAESPRSPVEAPPVPGPLSEARLPGVTRFRLRNGLTVVFVKDDRLPLVEARLSIPAGRTAERPGEEGLSQAAAGLLFSGLPDKDGTRLATELARLGWKASAGGDLRDLRIEASGLAKNAAPFFHELGRVLAQASFPEAEVSLWKRNTAQKLADLRSNPEFVMDERVDAEHYGAAHPYGRPLLTDEQLERVDGSGLRAFRERNAVPEGATLVVVGALEPGDARDMLEDTLKRWRGNSAAAEVPPAPELKPSRLALADRPGSTQANLTISLPVPLDRRHPDFLAFQVLSHILGGTSTSRLFVNLRVDKGFTYGSYSRQQEKGEGLLWVANAETRSEVALAALGEMQKEILRLRDEAVPAETLETAKRNLAGRFAIQLSAPETTASRLAALERAGVDSAEDLRTFVSRLEAITPADLQRVARLYLDPAKFLTVAVGDKATLEPLLAPYRP